MIRRIDLRGRDLDARSLRAVLPRASLDVEAATAAVRPIADAVRDRGEEAVLELSQRFDGVRPSSLRVPAEVLAAADSGLDPQVRAALEESIRRARLVHEAQRRTDVTTQVVPGGTVNNSRQSFSGAPTFGAGDEFVFFLWTSKAGLS
jgi:histidinol dehydrogenase